MSAVPAAILLAALAAAALLAEHVVAPATIALVLLAALLLRARGRAKLYAIAAFGSGLGVALVYPFLAVEGSSVLWAGGRVPVLGPIDVTVEELELAARSGFSLVAVALAFSAYALLLDHDRLLAAAGFARRSALAVALATRLVPTLRRDAAGLAEAVRGRGVAVDGLRGHARLLSPLVAGSLERSVNLAESMEARGFGRAGATRGPRPGWTLVDRAAVVAAFGVVAMGAVWL